ncbi:MAG TPA: putative aminohydrolase SsnA, partial [Bacteroidota bacterium]|nr:putative aminohydrolase SsnA [Bacteroidota bacterium]
NLVIKNTRAIVLEPPGITDCDIRIVDGEIEKVARSIRPARGEETVDLSGKIVVPGFVNAHTHLYSALSRGMPGPKEPPANFPEILRKIWWKLDEALDEESIYGSALAGAIEALKFGTTTLVDHHASPNHIHNSLDIIKDAISRVGIRGVLCYETTDRGGLKRRDQGLEENERFITENTNNTHFRGAMGAHACLTLGDDSLKKLGEVAETYDCGVHIHVAEDRADVVNSLKRYRIGVVDRLAKFGILRKKSIFAHGVHLNGSDIAKIRKSGTWMVHNPRSNMNNRVGYAPLASFGKRTALGTDGFPSDMFEEARLGYFRNVESGQRRTLRGLVPLIQNGHALVSEFFGRPFGAMEEGNAADLVVLDYEPPTPLHQKNIHGHFLFGMNSSHVQHVMVDGNWLVWDRRVVGIDEQKVMAEAAKVAAKLWKRMNA